ncbi:MAG: ABC transporter permease, partial [bacterium]
MTRNKPIMSSEVEERKKITRQLSYHEESRLRLKRRRLFDRWAKWVVASGGFTIIASILAILIFICIEIAPLFRAAKVRQINSFSTETIFSEFSIPSTQVVALGLEENQEVGYLISQTGVVQFFDLNNRRPREKFIIDAIQGQEITATWTALDGKQLLLGTSAGQAVVINIEYNAKFFEGTRSYRPMMTTKAHFRVDKNGQALKDIAFAGRSDESMAIAAITADNRLILFLRKREESLFGDAEIDSARFELSKNWTGRPISIAMDGAIQNLYVGSNNGKIYHWSLSYDPEPVFVSTARAAADDRVGITELTFLIGDRTLMVGDSQGKISAWFLVRDSTSTTGKRLKRIHELGAHSAPVTAIAASARGKGFISGDTQGDLLLQYSTSERTLAKFNLENGSGIQLINFAPKANGALSMDMNGNLTHWEIDNPHPEVGFKAFFGKVWYEGYQKPEYVWQSTGGSDDFEPKLSLVPLIFGSLKGTLYALIFAIPFAIFGAIYTSQFMHSNLRNYIKPTVEIMAALPSVVLGFLAGLWLAPRIEGIVTGVFTMFIVLPGLTVLSSFIWTRVPRKMRGHFRPGFESMLLVPILLFGFWLCLQLNSVLEAWLFAGDFKVWLYESLNLNYDQRNAMVVGF